MKNTKTGRCLPAGTKTITKMINSSWMNLNWLSLRSIPNHVETDRSGFKNVSDLTTATLPDGVFIALANGRPRSTVPSHGQRCNLIGSFRAEKRKRDTDTKGMKEWPVKTRKKISRYISTAIPTRKSMKHVRCSRSHPVIKMQCLIECR